MLTVLVLTCLAVGSMGQFRSQIEDLDVQKPLPQLLTEDVQRPLEQPLVEDVKIDDGGRRGSLGRPQVVSRPVSGSYDSGSSRRRLDEERLSIYREDPIFSGRSENSDVIKPIQSSSSGRSQFENVHAHRARPSTYSSFSRRQEEDRPIVYRTDPIFVGRPQVSSDIYRVGQSGSFGRSKVDDVDIVQKPVAQPLIEDSQTYEGDQSSSFGRPQSSNVYRSSRPSISSMSFERRQGRGEETSIYRTGQSSYDYSPIRPLKPQPQNNRRHDSSVVFDNEPESQKPVDLRPSELSRTPVEDFNNNRRPSSTLSRHSHTFGPSSYVRANPDLFQRT